MLNIFKKKRSEVEIPKTDIIIIIIIIIIILTFHMIFKIFFQNYPLSIDNAHGSLANMLQVREQGQGESSRFSYLLGR